MQASVPRPDTEAPSTIVSAITTSTTYQGSSIVDVTDAREITLLLTYAGNAASQRLSLLPLFSASATQPAATADEWFAPAINDGSVTAASLTATLISGADFTAAPEWGRSVQRSLEISFEGIDNATDEIRMAITLKCTWARWFQVQFAELGGGAQGVVTIQAVRSC